MIFLKQILNTNMFDQFILRNTLKQIIKILKDKIKKKTDRKGNKKMGKKKFLLV